MESKQSQLEEFVKTESLNDPNRRIEIIYCDVTKEEQVQYLVDETSKRFGRLDCVSSEFYLSDPFLQGRFRC